MHLSPIICVLIFHCFTPLGHEAIELEGMNEGEMERGEEGEEGGEGGGDGGGVEGGGSTTEIVSIDSAEITTSSEEHVSAEEGISPYHEGAVDEHLLKEVLDTRPTLLLGRSMSLRYRGGRSKVVARSESAYHRKNRTSDDDSPRRRLASAPGFANSKKSHPWSKPVQWNP